MTTDTGSKPNGRTKLNAQSPAPHGPIFSRLPWEHMARPVLPTDAAATWSAEAV